jgi:hypothetical protein
VPFREPLMPRYLSSRQDSELSDLQLGARLIVGSASESDHLNTKLNDCGSGEQE